MRFVSLALLLLGYVLVYAATANGGIFATDPWAGLYTDAYSVPPPGPVGGSGP